MEPNEMSTEEMRALALNTDLMWADVANIPWNQIPITSDDNMAMYARDVAGKARNFGEFYSPMFRPVQAAIESWLTRYSAEHTHPDLRT